MRPATIYSRSIRDLTNHEIRGLPVVHSLEEIDRPVDMVEKFLLLRRVARHCPEGHEIGAKVLWGQIGFYN